MRTVATNSKTILHTEQRCCNQFLLVRIVIACKTYDKNSRKSLTKVLVVAVTALLFTACSSNDDSDSNADTIADESTVNEPTDGIPTDGIPIDGVPTDGEPAVVELNGTYSIEAISEIEFDNDGGTCGDAMGEVTIADNAVRGNILSTNGLTLGVDGTLSETGIVTGGFAQGGNTVANFNGSFDGTSGSGEWQDNFGCEGTWTSVRVIE